MRAELRAYERFGAVVPPTDSRVRALVTGQGQSSPEAEDVLKI